MTRSHTSGTARSAAPGTPAVPAPVLEEDNAARPRIFESRLRLLHAALTTQEPGRTLSVGAGSGAFEVELARRFGLDVDVLAEPDPDLAAAARARGFTVWERTSQELDPGEDAFDTIYYHGSSFGYIPDDQLEPTWARDLRALRPGGRLVLTDVPKESALGILLLTLQKYPDIDHTPYEDLIAGTAFPRYREHFYKPYWHRTDHYIGVLEGVGFADLTFLQTVLANPPYQDDHVEDPVAGYRRGNYVAIIAQRPLTARR